VTGAAKSFPGIHAIHAPRHAMYAKLARHPALNSRSLSSRDSIGVE
jgi:hypothetical protein